MVGRRVLVIGSQNEVLGRLSFLPRVAERLHALMTTGPGECVGVELKDRPAGLLLDPTVDEMKAAIRVAVQQAAAAGDSLIVGYVGHGVFSNGRFYLMPLKSVEPKPGGAVDIARFLGECLLDDTGGRGVTVLIDACHAGEGVKQAMKDWADGVQQDHAFELLTATDDRVTAGAPLFHTLIRLLERGAPESEAGARLRCRDVYRRLDTEHYPARLVESGGDLHLGRNNARDPGDVFWNWKGSPSSPVILQRTLYFQPTAELRRLVAASESDPVVYLTGAAGTGKSTLASALVRPELTDGAVPEGFVQAIAILNAQTTELDLARDLEKQLRRTVAGFAGAVEAFQRSRSDEEWRRLNYIDQKVIGPLVGVSAGARARIVLDGLDQVSEPIRKTILTAFLACPPALRLIVTAHAETFASYSHRTLSLQPTAAGDIEAYLKSRGVAAAARTAIQAKATNQWLVAQLLADAVLADPTVDLAQLPGTLEEAYAKRLAQATGGCAADWHDRFGPILSLLAVAGSGPILPLPLLAKAASLDAPKERRGSFLERCVRALFDRFIHRMPSGHKTPAGASQQRVREVLDALGGLVVRGDAGGQAEQVGFFHASLPEYLSSSSAARDGFEVDALSAHRAMTGAIDALAPQTERLAEGSVHRYAFLREAYHLWEAGDNDRAFDSLFYRTSNVPRENLARWEEWLSRFAADLRADDPRVLRARGQVLFWMEEGGDARGALSRCQALLADVNRVLGPDDPEVLTMRNQLAYLTGRCGDDRGALKAYQALLPDRQRVLGRDHPDVLRLRNNIAALTGKCGDWEKALSLFKALVPDMERVFGGDDPDVLKLRNNVAGWTGENGDAAGALGQFKALQPDMVRALGPDDPDVLRLRNNVALWTGRNGDPRAALGLSEALQPDMKRVLGPDHPDTLTNRVNIALFTGRCGRVKEARTSFGFLLKDMVRVLGPDHPNVLQARAVLAGLTGEDGDRREAAKLFEALLPDMERVLGCDHPATLTLIAGLGTSLISGGRQAEGCRWLREGLARARARFGVGHPMTGDFEYGIEACGCDSTPEPITPRRRPRRGR